MPQIPKVTVTSDMQSLADCSHGSVDAKKVTVTFFYELQLERVIIPQISKVTVTLDTV